MAAGRPGFWRWYEGTGPPLHSHGWDEAFFVMEGEVEFSTAGKTTTCTPGTLVHLPADTVHGFRFGPGGGRMLEVTGAGSGASKMFTNVDREIEPGPPDIAKLVALLRDNGVSVAE